MLSYSTSETGETSLVAEVSRGSSVEPFRILMREARWSESFLPLSRREVFNWAAGFLRKAMVRALVYVSGVIATRLTRPEGTAWPARFIVLLTVALGWLVLVLPLWAVAIAVYIAMSILLAFSSVLLLIPLLRDAAASVVLSLVEAIGDPAVLVSRPARAGAMRQHVEDSLKSLREEAGSQARITMVAHSQGAAIATEVLFAIGGATNAGGYRELMAQERVELPTPCVHNLITIGAGVNLLGAGYGNGGPLRGSPVAAWHRSQGAERWINLWATWDPISGGAIVDQGESRAAATRDARIGIAAKSAPGMPLIEEHQVRNTASFLTDHQSYVANIPEVIDRIVDAVLARDPESAREENPDQEALRLRWSRLVRIHGFNRIVIAATGLAVAVISVVPGRPFIQGAISFVSDLLGLTELMKNPFFSWLEPWVPVAVVLIVVTVVLLWLSTRLRAAVERRKVWDIEAGWSGALAAMHLPFTGAIGLASAATAAFAVSPLLPEGSTVIATEIPLYIGVGIAVLTAWIGALALALDVPRIRPPEGTT